MFKHLSIVPLAVTTHDGSMTDTDVCFTPQADMVELLADVRFVPKSRYPARTLILVVLRLNTVLEQVIWEAPAAGNSPLAVVYIFTGERS